MKSLPRPSVFAWSTWGLGVASAAGIAVAIFFGDVTSGVVGAIGLVILTTGVVLWLSGHWVRKKVRESTLSGAAAWTVLTKLVPGSRYSRCCGRVDDGGLSLAFRHAETRIAWPQIESVMIQNSRPFRFGSVVLCLTDGRTITLEVLASNAVTAVSEEELQRCAALLDDHRTVKRSAA